MDRYLDLAKISSMLRGKKTVIVQMDFRCLHLIQQRRVLTRARKGTERLQKSARNSHNGAEESIETQVCGDEGTQITENEDNDPIEWPARAGLDIRVSFEDPDHFMITGYHDITLEKNGSVDQYQRFFELDLARNRADFKCGSAGPRI